MKILVTGGAGFIGSNIIDSYILNGHDVVVLDNFYSGKKEYINPKATFYEMDVTDKKISDIFSKERFDIVNHHAAQMNVRLSVEDPIFDAKINVLGILNLLENCRKYGVKKFIFASSGGAVYGDQDKYPISEDAKRKPYSPYGMSKKISEDYIDYFHRIYGLKYTNLRYPNVYGPRQNPHGEAGIVAIFLDLLINNQNVKIYGDGTQIRDYIFISDVVKANNIVLNKGDNNSFNVGTGVPTNVNQIYEKLKKITNSNGVSVNVSKKEGDVMKNYLNSGKAKSFLDWEHKIDLDQGLKLTYEWFRTK